MADADATFLEEDLGWGSEAPKAETPSAAPPQPEPEQTPQVEAQPPPEPVVEEAPEPQATPEPPTEAETPVSRGLQTALEAERKMRQEAERRAAFLEGLAKGQENRQLPPKTEEDPAKQEELDRLYFDNPREYTEKRAREIAASIVVEQRITDSARRMATEAKDYKEVMKQFLEHANQPGNQYLWQQLQQVSDPAREAYNYMKNVLNPPQPFDPEAERERIRAEERERIRKEMAGEAVDEVPKSPALAPGAGPGAAPAQKRGPSFDEFLDDNEVG